MPLLKSPSHLPFPHEAVASLDPLGAAGALRRLPELNRADDLEGLTRLLLELLPVPSQVESWGSLEAAAAMRDIGMLLGSLKRHGHEPVEVVPPVEPLLLRLACKSDMPPRDTILHYTSWNPRGEARRTYTGLPEEVHLIESVCAAMPRLEQAILLLTRLYETPIASGEFTRLCGEISQYIREVGDSLSHVYRQVSPQVFALQLRPYFDPVRVGGQLYLGPGAVEMPLFVFDHILWGATLEQPSYTEFKARYLSYVLPGLRACHVRHTGRPSLVDSVVAEVKRSGPLGTEACASVEGLRSILNGLVRFRAPHLRLAERSYAQEASNAREVGSGGYSATMLHELLALTLEARKRIEACLQPQALALPA